MTEPPRTSLGQASVPRTAQLRTAQQGVLDDVHGLGQFRVEFGQLVGDPAGMSARSCVGCVHEWNRSSWIDSLRSRARSIRRAA